MFPSQRPQSTAKKTDGDDCLPNEVSSSASAFKSATTKTSATESSSSSRRQRETDPLLGGGRGGGSGSGRGGGSGLALTTSVSSSSSASTVLRARRSSKSPVLLATSANHHTTTTSTKPYAASMQSSLTQSNEPSSRTRDDALLPSHGSYEAIQDTPAEQHTAAVIPSLKTSYSLPFATTGHTASQEHHSNVNVTAPAFFESGQPHNPSSGEGSAQSASSSAPPQPLLPQHHSIQSQRSRGSLSSSTSSSAYRHVPPAPTSVPRTHSSDRHAPPQHYPPTLGHRGGGGGGVTPRGGGGGGGGGSQDDGSQYSQTPSPILEIPEEIYTVRKAALQVLKPLTKTWVVISVGFALTVLFGTARWTRLMPGLPFWFILLPSWSAHLGLLWLHILSAQALSTFIADANESRQRPDSRDHLNRTEYLPLLQRSLKFGLKTGLLSFFVFVFEILIYVRMARGSISLTAAFVPLWILVSGGILDGLICKTQHFLRVLCWIFAFAAMVMIVLKVDYQCDGLRWRVVISPVVAILSIASGTLIYIVYGHQVGYYRLTESQLTAGNLYSLAALICIVLMVMIGEVIPLSRPVEIQTRLFVVILAPLVVCLVGMGAWVVSRDEFARLLLYGGQSAVHPMKLRWEAKGWTCVQGKGVVMIPMFGEVSFQPLERKPTERVVELLCCQGSCYPYEDEDEETVHLTQDTGHHPYLDPLHSRNAHQVYRGL